MTITSKLKEKSIDYWDFSGSKLSGIHKICSYPATMVPDMQKELIEMVIESDDSINNILDPFHGSGVTLVEGASLGLTPIGFDINPLANLMTLVKLQGVNKKLLKASNKKIIKILLDDNIYFPKHEFKNIDKWFRDDIIMSLSKVKYAIEQERYKNIRQYYWVCMINIIKKYSNTRSSTFKLHIKKEQDIAQMKDNIFEDFCKKISTSFKHLPDYTKEKKVLLSVGDTSQLLTKIEHNSIDLICTSPPYGDNGTTVTYGQYSMLPLFWMNKKDLAQFDESLLENYSSIDSASLGGKRQRRNKQQYNLSKITEYLKKISQPKQRKVRDFVNDYLNAFDKMCDVLKPGKLMIVTLGNRRVDNQILPLTEITKDFLLDKNFSIEAELSRNIPVKRMPRKVSRVNNESVKSMNTEYILILKKYK